MNPMYFVVTKRAMVIGKIAGAILRIAFPRLFKRFAHFHIIYKKRAAYALVTLCVSPNRDLKLTRVERTPREAKD
jgi:hypothetical protein